MKKLFLMSFTIAAMATTAFGFSDPDMRELFRERQERMVKASRIRAMVESNRKNLTAYVTANANVLQNGRIEANKECVTLKDADLVLLCQNALLNHYNLDKGAIIKIKAESRNDFLTIAERLIVLINN